MHFKSNAEHNDIERKIILKVYLQNESDPPIEE
jgi:hypothetical protein